MPDIKFRCPSCGNPMQAPSEKAGARGRCPKCSTPIVVPRPVKQSQTALPSERTEKQAAPIAESQQASPSRTAPLPTLQPKQPAEQRNSISLPERMRANRVVAGKTCPICNAEIELGDPVINCQKCGASSHEHCHSVAGGCPSLGCRPRIETPSLPRSNTQTIATATVSNELTDSDLLATMNLGSKIPCPYCGETIYSTAKKCRFCNEFLEESLRAAHSKLQISKSEDDDMTTADIIFCVICSGIACIAGLVYGIQGKKKGWKMMALSLVMQLVWIFLNIIAQVS